MANKTQKYTESEINEIKKVFSKKNNIKAKRALSKKLNKSLASLASKYKYEKMRDEGTLQAYNKKTKEAVIKNKRLKNLKKPSLKEKTIEVTHVDKAVVLSNAQITIGEAVITVFSPQVVINGTLITF